jgi:hypothetical protein
MAQLTIEVEDRLLVDMTALARAKRRGTVEIVGEAIAEYVRAHGAVRPTKSVKVAGAGCSVSVTAGARQPSSLAERKRLSERTCGMWKDREVDGLRYQLEQRARFFRGFMF